MGKRDAEHAEIRWQSRVAAVLANSDEDPTARFAQLATVACDGMPYNRTVVIRAFRPRTGELRIVTDARSQKIAHLRADPRAALCWYLTSSRQQFRFRGPLMLVDTNVDEAGRAMRRSAWASVSSRTQRQFLWPAPGSPKLERSTDTEIPPGEPPDTFVLLRFIPNFVDHLVLTSTPHQRTFYRLDDTAHWLRQPVNP